MVNLTTSVKNEDKLVELRSQALRIMHNGSFRLRCWAWNRMKDQEDQIVLGLKWNTENDELYCTASDISETVNEKFTKRSLLSIINSIYNPIGFTSLATLLPKLLLLRALQRKLDWDEELPTDI